MSQRIDRVDELLREEIGAILAKDVQDPHIGFATVTDVETTPDLRHAKVWVSVIGAPAERRETIEGLDRAMAYVRHELGARLRLRRIPALHVTLDDSAERGTRVMRILDELEAGDVVGGEAIIDSPRGESLPTPVARVRQPGEPEEDDAAEAPAAAAGAKGAPAGGPGGAGRRPRRPAPDARVVGPRRNAPRRPGGPKR
jgi:ribosome-binding factor A